MAKKHTVADQPSDIQVRATVAARYKLHDGELVPSSTGDFVPYAQHAAKVKRLGQMIDESSDRNVSYLVEIEKLKQQLARKQMDVEKLQRQLDVAILKPQLQRTPEQRADGLLLDAIATDLFPKEGA